MDIYRIGLSINRKFLGLFAAMILFGSTAYGQNGALGMAYPARGITIDGDLRDWPKDLQAYPIQRIETGDNSRGEDDLKAHFRIAYDAGEHALYVAVEVRDDSIVLDGPGEVVWNAQDGCELFIDANQAESGPSVAQFARYGNQDRFVGPTEFPERPMKVAVVRSDSRIVYEWRIEIGGEFEAGRAIGFDVSVADKDKDGSFSWAAWGSGTQKAQVANRVGEILLVTPETRFGEVSGHVAWKDPSPSALPSRVRLQAARSASFWRGATVDSTGAYRAANLPPGPYTVHPVDSPDLRVETKAHVDVQVEADQVATAELLRVTPIPWPGLIRTEGVLLGSVSFDADEFSRFVQSYLDYYQIPGISVAVIKESKIVYHNGFGVKNAGTREKVTDDTIFEAASMTKPVFAYTVLRLVDRGVLTLDTPLFTYLPYEDIAYDNRYKLITARMVLTHRTGFPNWRTGKLDIKFTPGTEVSYSGEGFVYLGKVVEHLTGKKLVDLCREEVFVPLDMKNASLVYNEDVARLTAIGHDHTSPLSKWKMTEPNMAASLQISAGNYSKFLIAALQGKGLAEPNAREMLRPQVKMPNEPGASWGLGIAIAETPLGTHYGHGGRNTGFTSQSVMYKDQGIGYVFLVNNDDAAKIDNVLNAYLIAGKSGLKNSKPIARKAVQVDSKVFDAYVGRFEIAHETIVTISRDGDRLMIQPAGDAKFEIFPESETVFFIKPTTDETLTFIKDNQGRVIQFVLSRDGHETKATRLDGETKADAPK